MTSATIGEWLFEARTLCNMTQSQAASISGLSRQTIMDIELGRCDPRLSTVSKICGVYNLVLEMREDLKISALRAIIARMESIDDLIEAVEALETDDQT